MLTVALLAALIAPAPSPYDVRWEVDVPLFLAVWTLTETAPDRDFAQGSCRLAASGICDDGELSAIDRIAVGRHSRSWERVSDHARDATSVIAMLGILATYVQDDSAAAVSGALADGLMLALAAETTTLATQVLKSSVRRSRPLQYDRDTYEDDEDHLRSFPSGHVSRAAAVSAAYGVTVLRRYPESFWRWLYVGVAAGLTGLTAVGRVQAGQHFVTDVVAGALLGGAIGLGLPAAHLSEVAVVPQMLEGGAGVSARVRF